MGFYSNIFQEILEIVFFLFKLNGLDLFAAYLACISLTKFETAVDLSQEPNVTKCNIRLANEEDFSVRIYASLQCRFGASGRYVYIYKLGYGSVVLNEVIVLEEARSYELTGGYDCKFTSVNGHTVCVMWCFINIWCSAVTSLPQGPLLLPWYNFHSSINK